MGDKIAGQADQVRLQLQTEFDGLLDETKAAGPGGVEVGQMQNLQGRNRVGGTDSAFVASDFQAKRLDQANVASQPKAARAKAGEEFSSREKTGGHAVKAASQSFETGS